MYGQQGHVGTGGPCFSISPSELLALWRRVGYNEPMETIGQTLPAVSAPRHSAPSGRFVLAWALLIGSLVGFWCCRPWLGTRTFNYGQLAVFLVTWKIASLICLAPGAWARLTPLRLLAYCFWYGMQPQQFLKGQVTAANAPLPTVSGILLNALAGATLLWLVPYLLPAATPPTVRFGIALVGLGFLTLFARLDVVALIFRAMGFAVEKVMDFPIAATTLGDFWGRRWNRIVSGMLREVIFFPVARWLGARVALFAVFLYSALYHEGLSFMAGSGYGGPSLYFLVQYLGLAIENSRPARRLLLDRPWLGRAWTWAVVVLPVRLFLRPGLVDGFLVPLLVQTGVPGLER
jgi:alginate O-acetyltransferase complex protein AlgI